MILKYSHFPSFDLAVYSSVLTVSKDPTEKKVHDNKNIQMSIIFIYQ